MRIHYDHREDALYLEFNNRPYAESDDVRDGVVFDYDKRGKIIGIEILNASRVLSVSSRSSWFKEEMPAHTAR
ncbi:DUF2283 domain-containing protein [Candidatus Parcubacteria bacterium]|nr:DUF2283 domain-containing protein [Candidatus Parcubacteria bacterium]MBI4099091.1 DUF2283 domain-containing protein [Candidatus Parcubacteria bacterium]MBI4385655.1 DUF2283 domain-containing protein [Candidatus Parcubacteria bacterium]